MPPMVSMPTVVATQEPTNWPPRWRLNVSVVVVGGASSATITRRNADGTTYTVRTATSVAISGGSLLAYDYESPFRMGGTYTVTLDDGRTATVTVPGLWEFGVDSSWLIHPGIPDLSLPVTVSSVGARTRAARQGVHQVAGRPEPVVNGDGTRGAEQFTLGLRTAWDDNLESGALQDEDRLRRILDDGSPLLFQHTYPGSRRWRWQWVSIGDVTEDYTIAPWSDSPWLEWSLPCTVVQSPTGGVQAQWTLGGVAGRYATLGDVAAAYATLGDLAIDRVSP